MGPRKPTSPSKDKANPWVFSLLDQAYNKGQKHMCGPISPQANNKGLKYICGHTSSQAYH